jgi:hypothetical protein
MMRIVLALPLLLAGIASVQAAPLPRYGIFNYARLCYSARSDDWDGIRIVVMRMREGDTVMFERADGPPEMPLTGGAKVGPGNSIAFSLEIPWDPTSNPTMFEGRFDAHRLIGALRAGTQAPEQLDLPFRALPGGDSCR